MFYKTTELFVEKVQRNNFARQLLLQPKIVMVQLCRPPQMVFVLYTYIPTY